MQNLCVVAKTALPPADKVQIHFFFEFLGAEGVPDFVDDELEGLYNLGDGFAEGLLHAEDGLNPPEHIFDGGEDLPDLIEENLIFIAGYNTIVVEEISFSSFEIDVDIIDDVILFSKPIFVEYDNCFLLGDISLFDVVGDL